MKFAPLVENEILKLLKRRRFRVALLILVALNGLIVFAQTQTKDRRPARDWRIALSGSCGASRRARGRC